MASQSESNYFGPYLVLAFSYKLKFLNSHRAGWDYFKDCLTDSSDSVCSVMVIDVQNKKRKIRIRWRNGHTLQSHETHAVHLNIDGISKQD